MQVLLIVLLVLLLAGVFPAYRFSGGFGAAPISLVTLLVIVLIVLLLSRS